MAKDIARAAHARGYTIAEYLGQLVELHRQICRLADENPYAADALGTILKDLHLETVRT